MPRFIDLTGKVFNRLTVLGKSKEKGSQKEILWDCLCSCGGVTKARGHSLKSGNTTSCGCRKKETQKENSKILQEFSLKSTLNKENGETGKKNLFSNMKSQAKNRKISWGLSEEQVYYITKLNCCYCGSAPHQVSRMKYKNPNTTERMSYTYTGIDRIDSNKGYEPFNVVPCCVECNVSKMDSTLYDWLLRMALILAVDFDLEVMKDLATLRERQIKHYAREIFNGGANVK